MSLDDEVRSLDVEALRADFPILSSTIRDGVPLVYLDNAASTQRPRQVIQRIVDTYEQSYANVHRGIHSLSESATDLYEQSRQKIQRFINAETPEQVIFTTGATAGINLVARSWGDANLGEGDEILVTEMEHHSNLVPWHQLADRTGAKIRAIPITDDGQLDLAQLPNLLTEKTKVLAVAAVSNVLGTINPIAELAAKAHAVGAIIVVDAAQSVPHEVTDVQELDVDFLCFSGHKMLGPSGIGILYGRRELLEAMPPFMGGGSMIRRVQIDSFTSADLPAKFEAGTPPIAPAIGLGAAVDYLNNVGLENVAAHELKLTKLAHEILGQIEGMRFLGPTPELKCGIVSFRLDRVPPHDVAELLDRDGIAVRAGHHCTKPLHKRLKISASSRASFYLYNTPSEVEKLGEALEKARQFFTRRNR